MKFKIIKFEGMWVFILIDSQVDCVSQSYSTKPNAVRGAKRFAKRYNQEPEIENVY